MMSLYNKISFIVFLIDPKRASVGIKYFVWLFLTIPSYMIELLIILHNYCDPKFKYRLLISIVID